MANSSDDASQHRWWSRMLDWLHSLIGGIWTMIIVGGLVAVVVTWAFTPWGTDFSRYPVGFVIAWLWEHLPVVLVTAICLLFLLVLLAILRQRASRVSTPSGDFPMTDEVRKRELNRLFRRYQGSLKQSLLGPALMKLRFQQTFEATYDPAPLVTYRPDGVGQEFAPGKTILQVYDEVGAGEGLLILGEPGAGKSTVLLELALALTKRAEHNTTQPLPILVHLSSWATKQSLQDWLVEELYDKYQIKLQDGKAWLQMERLLPLLDGLNEMAEKHRSACITAINTYRKDHHLPLVVSSRNKEYFSQQDHLQLLSAVMIQPLTPQEVNRHLGKPSLAAVREVLDRNPILHKLLTTPLMLSVVIKTYQDKKVGDLPRTVGMEEQQRQIFDDYVKRMLERDLPGAKFKPQQVQQGLVWLAEEMQQDHQLEFYLERLQFRWLPKVSQIIYSVWSRLLSALAYGLLVGLFFGLLTGAPWWSNGFQVGLFIGLLGGFFFAHEKKDEEIHSVDVLEWHWKRFWEKIGKGLWIGLRFGLIGGLFLGVFVAVLNLLFIRQSWQQYGLLGALAVALASLIGLPVFLGLFSALFGGVMGALLGGWVWQETDYNERNKPLQGIHDSGRSALRVGLVSMLLVGMAVSLSFRTFLGLSTGLIAGIIGGLFFGGRTYLQYYALRFLLWRSRIIPWKYVQFLEEACLRILLRRTEAGGGYRFFHSILQAYFAKLKQSSPSIASDQSKD
jgi:energy-coupling factor transporter ATP-binding protein EcfA2